jgi:hypothetical protein
MSEPPAARPADSRSRLAIRGEAVRISGAALTRMAGKPAEDDCLGSSVDNVFDPVDGAFVPVDGVFDELLLTLADSLAAAMVLEVNGVAVDPVESVFGSARLVVAVLFEGLHSKINWLADSIANRSAQPTNRRHF